MWIVSDIDGTLLDASERCPLPPELLTRAGQQHRIVLASSRTLPQIRAVAYRLGWDATRCVAEDGQVVLGPDGGSQRLGSPAATLQARLAAAGVHDHFRSVPGREASLLIRSTQLTEALRDGVERAGLAITVGGRWATVSDGQWNKGSAVVRLLSALGVVEWAAIGNAANDAPLLQAATRRFVIRNVDGGYDSSLADIPDVVLLTAPGPLGWVEMLEQLPLTPTPEPEGNDAKTRLDHHGPDDPGA